VLVALCTSQYLGCRPANYLPQQQLGMTLKQTYLSGAIFIFILFAEEDTNTKTLKTNMKIDFTKKICGMNMMQIWMKGG
jgi:hypothetical protein